MKNPLLTPELREMLAAGDARALQEFCEAMHPALAAEFISALDADEAWAVLEYVALPVRAVVFSHLDAELQAETISKRRRDEIARLFSDMPPDDRADIFKRLPEEQQESILPALAQAEREDIRRLAAYEEGTAGAVMTSDYAALQPDLTASQAIEHLRTVAPDKETIYYAYVLDERRALQGFVSLKDLVVAPRDARVKDIMHRDIIFARARDDQEEAARKIQKYDLLALPVIDDSDALVGIITHDDALDIVTQELTEDMEKLMAIAGSHEAGVYLRTPWWVHFKNRVWWIVGLAGVGLVSGVVIHSFEGALTRLIVLALYMPMVADTGGNTGSQSAALVVRALALGEITHKDTLRVLAKELKVSLLLGVVLGLLSWGKVMFLSQRAEIPPEFSLATIGAAIAIALGLQVVSATLIGALLPLGAARMKWDPAIVASPALTTVVDITGLLIYFTIAKVLLSV